MSSQREFTLRIESEEGMMWAEVVELPGTFASGETLDELVEALTEAISVVLEQDGRISAINPAGATPLRRRRRKSPPMPTAQIHSAKMSMFA